MTHRPGFTHDLGSLPAQPLAGANDFFNADSQMTEGIAEIISMGVPVIGQFDYGLFAFRSIADKGEGEFSFRIIFPAEKLHP
jgi:hypothetical protein